MEPSTSPNFDRIFDPEGNLILRVGGAGGYYSNQHAYYRVCSATLNRASPVFRTRIRSAHYDDWIIFLDLAEDYKSGLEVMLAILHGDFDSLPTKPSISLLYKVISTAEKYQISHMIRPWAKDWFLAAVRKRTCNVEEWFQKIYLARKFGSENLFLAEAVALFMQSTLNKNGLLVHRFPGADRSVRLQDFDFYAPGLTAAIGDIRRQLLGSLLASCNRRLEWLGSTTSDGPCRDSNNICTTEIPFLVFPKEASDVPHESVSSLLRSIQGGPMRLAFPCEPRHRDCSTDRKYAFMEEELEDDARRAIKEALLPYEVWKEMNERRKYWGMAEDVVPRPKPLIWIN